MEEVEDDIESFVKMPVQVFKQFLIAGTIGMLLMLTKSIIALVVCMFFILFALAVNVVITLIMLFCFFIYKKYQKQILINIIVLWLNLPIAILYSYLIDLIL
jgi:hypothetical protein